MVKFEEPTVTVYATTTCGDCTRSKWVLDRLGVPYRWIDINQDPEATDLVRRLNDGLRRVPTIVFADGSYLAEPSNPDLVRRLVGLGLTRERR